ncbi:MAG TPA: TIGR00730 family Rossman fold protein, partial [Micavibrio sp.]
MKSIKNVCVYCGSSAAVDDLYKNSATALGEKLAYDGMTLVYGGGASGLMGMTADATMAAGGKVIGIFPEFLGRFETPHKGLTEIFIVD